MTEVFVVLAFVAVLLLVLIGFRALDRWHQRYAWRRAHEEAERYMRERYGEQRWRSR